MKSFSESGLKSELLKSLERINFVSPTPIQHQAINHLLQSDQDLIGMAHTGTGKTAAFALPIIHRTHLEIKKVQTIVLCPTRELCLQISKDVESYTRDLREFKVVAVYGGAPITHQINDLRKGCHMVIGTPGRTLDLINRKKLQLEQVRWVVLDEADEMLSMGFKDELDQILESTPSNKQTLLFSATMPPTITSIANNYMSNPLKISVDPGKKTTSNISHGYFIVDKKNKFDFLKFYLSLHSDIYAIIFCRTKKDTGKIADDLVNDGFEADALHGDLSQRQRDRVLTRFRNRQINLLVATDVAARGLDVTELTHVINYDLPDEPEAYVHRSGRTGRAGKSGDCICLIEKRDMKRLHFISRKTDIRFNEAHLPDQTEILGQKIDHTIEKVLSLSNSDSSIIQFLPEVDQKLFNLSRQELIGRFLTLVLKKEIPQNPVISPVLKTSKDKRLTHERKVHKREEYLDQEFTRFYINLGTKHNLDKIGLMGLINRYMKGDDFLIGNIEMLKSFSFFEIESGYEQRVLSGFKKAEFGPIKIAVEISLPKPAVPVKSKQKRKKEKRKF